MSFPTVLVVHDNLGVPLREIKPSAAAPLTPWECRWTRVPPDVDRQRIAGRERARQAPMRDRRIGSIRIVRLEVDPHHRRRRDPLERIVGVLHVLKPHASFRRIHRGPARAGTKGVQVLVDVEIAERVGRLIDVRDPHIAAQHTTRLVERGDDLVSDPLLPVSRIRRDNDQQKREHGPGISRLYGAARKERTLRFARVTAL